ncbi:MAG TPA: hypothetical protein VHZ03_04820 [Trebonia sp.]|jgi:hypothetical protein|nr:hypothetical protein [Trebonia sp.]
MSDLAATVISMEYEQVTGILAGMRLDPCLLAPRFLGLIDANAILSSVDNDGRKGPHWRSRLLRMTSGGITVLYAPDHIYTEVYRRLLKIARSSPVPLDVLRERFEAEYLPVLRCVTVDTAVIADPRVLAITDADDVSTEQLAKLIAPCVVFSEDRHLRSHAWPRRHGGRPRSSPSTWSKESPARVSLAQISSSPGRAGVGASDLRHPQCARDHAGRRPIEIVASVSRLQLLQPVYCLASFLILIARFAMLDA